MNNCYEKRVIYILGNGFDIAAGLPTRYTDFMLFVDNWQLFYEEYSMHFDEQEQNHYLQCPPEGRLTKEVLLEYATHTTLFNDENIQRLDTILKDNVWLLYFQHCEYKNPSWAGFEKEIREALQVTNQLFKNNTRRVISGFSTHEKAVYTMFRRINKRAGKKANGSDFVFMGNEEEIQKSREGFIDTIAKELLEFSEAFRLYLLEFVERMKPEKDTGLLVNETTQTYIISLNYTRNQFIKAGLDQRYIHMIHGSDDKQNNLVIGIENDNSLGIEFIRFMKYFQRIQKRTGTDYKNFFSGGANQFGNPIPYQIIFFGHSLDPIDADFIRDIILKCAKTKVFIHYYDQKDYEQKVINCVKIFGSDHVIDAVAKKEIVFTDETLRNILLLE